MRAWWLRSDNMLVALYAFSSYETPSVAEDQGKFVVPAKEQPLMGDIPAGRKSLAEFKGKKPLLIILADPKDIFTIRHFPLHESLYQAYRDRVECYYISTPWDEGALTVSKTAYGTHNPATYFNYSQNARSAKTTYIAHPCVSMPCLLDSVGQVMRSWCMDRAGNGCNFLVDREGIVAAFGTQNAFDAVVWANEVEWRLQRLLAANGLYSPDWSAAHREEVDKTVATARKTKGGLTYTRRKTGFTPWLCGRIESVDVQKGMITVIPRLPTEKDSIGFRFWQKDKDKISDYGDQNLRQVNLAGSMATLERWLRRGAKPIRFDVSALAYDSTKEDLAQSWKKQDALYLNGRRANGGDLRPGDFVGVKYAEL